MSQANVTLYGFIPFGELVDMSPFVAKVQNYLRLADIPHQKWLGDLRKAPRNKLPFIEFDGQRITDSAQIIRHLEAAPIGNTLDAALSHEQRCELTALSSMLELELYFIAAYFRWTDDRGWAIYRNRGADYFAELGIPRFVIPAMIPIVRKQFVRALEAQGVGRRDADENLARVAEILDALEYFKGRHDGPYWFGAKPTTADAMGHAFVATTVRAKLGVGCEGMLDERPKLRAWFEHLDAELRG